jgi:myosin V
MQVEEWVLSAGVETVGQSWEELRFIRQAVEFLVLGAKQKKQLADIQHNLCSELSVQQLYRISTMYWDDKYGTETVSGEVLQQMRAIMQVHSLLFPYL